MPMRVHRLPGREPHIHFYCEECRRTFCIEDVKIPVVALPEGYRIETINYTVKGLCPECSKRQA